MIEIRFHGRGGQGAVTSSNILAAASFNEGRYAQAFAVYGAERRGAPNIAFTRIDSAPIRLRTMVYEPDGVVVMDARLTDIVDVSSGLKKDGWIIVNSSKKKEDFPALSKFRLAVFDANAIAREFKLGPKNMPIINTAILGAIAGFSEVVSLDSILKAMDEYVPVKVEENKKATQRAYDTYKKGGR